MSLARQMLDMRGTACLCRVRRMPFPSLRLIIIILCLHDIIIIIVISKSVAAVAEMSANHNASQQEAMPNSSPFRRCVVRAAPKFAYRQ